MTTEPRVMHVCEWCEQRWASPISAALCCDSASFNDDDEPGRIYRGLE